MPDVELPYQPRWYQQDFEDAMFGGKRRAFLVYHRRAGKDIACLNFLVNCAVADSPGLYYYILPTYAQGKKVIWDGIDEGGTRLIDYIPKEFIDGKPNQTEMKIRLRNGSLIQIVGAEQYDNLRGTNPKGVVLSEYAQQDPRCWEEVISPILRKNRGWAVFNTTPFGRNHAYETYYRSLSNDKWYCKLLTVQDTGLIAESEIDEERKEGKSEEVIQQEYYCCWDRGVDGTYYGRLVNELKKKGRVTTVDYQRSSAVNTYWDLGFGDSTSIIFAQLIGQEVHVIDYYEASGEGFAHYVKVLQDKGYNYGEHWGPHDIESGQLNIGMSLRQYALDFGLTFNVVPKTTLDYGIEAGRVLFDRVWIDETKCDRLIRCLENYAKKYNAKQNCYSNTPVHNEFSHGADSWRYLAQATRISKGSGLSPDKIRTMRDRHRKPVLVR